jgi:hypothetical protein
MKIRFLVPLLGPSVVVIGVTALLAAYGLLIGGSGPADEIVVTPTRPTATTIGSNEAEVAAAREREPESVPLAVAADLDGPTWRTTVVPDLLLRADPTLDAIAHLQLPVGTPVEVFDGTAVGDDYEWVLVRVEDGTIGWLITEGVE